MKTLKIALVVLVSALAIVSCKKTDMRPACNHEDRKAESENTEPAQASVARPADNTFTFDNVYNGDTGSDIYGSGDDDRDGGDKKQKKTK